MAYKWPTTSTNITQYFGGSHYGIDIGGSTGDSIYAMTSGNVRFVYDFGSTGYGKVIYINHDIGGGYLQTRYAHLSDIDVKVGDYVTQGKKIGELGNTGSSTGPHLHFETRECVSSGCTNSNSSSTPVNPLNYVSP